MFRRLHYKLTGLCASVTIGILILFTALYLHTSEHTLKENRALSFQHDFDTICSSLEYQQTLSHHYLLQLEARGVYLFLWDNGTPLRFNSLQTHASVSALAQELYTSYQEKAADAQSSPLRLFYQELAVPSAEEGTGLLPMQAGISTVQHPANPGAGQTDGGLVLLVVSPEDAFLGQLRRQRLLFGLLSLSGCLMLTLSAFLFTGKLLRPIRENQERQLRFVADASHELRTPLAVILSSVDARTPRYEETIREEVLRMSRLVDSMLALASLESRSLKLQLSPLAPDTFLLNLYEQFEPLARREQIKADLALPREAVPTLTADRDRLKQLLLILLQNALTYAPPGSTVTLKLFSTGRWICFQVEDHGIGIADCEKEKIFQRFYQVDGSRSRKGHFGLGLCLAREIAEAHHGRIEVSDTPGGGASFTCRLPVD